MKYHDPVSAKQPSSQAVQMGTKWSAGQIIDESLSSVERSPGWAGLGWAGLGWAGLGLLGWPGLGWRAIKHENWASQRTAAYLSPYYTILAYSYKQPHTLLFLQTPNCLPFHFDVMCDTFYNWQISITEQDYFPCVGVCQSPKILKECLWSVSPTLHWVVKVWHQAITCTTSTNSDLNDSQFSTAFLDLNVNRLTLSLWSIANCTPPSPVQADEVSRPPLLHPAPPAGCWHVFSKVAAWRICQTKVAAQIQSRNIAGWHTTAGPLGCTLPGQTIVHNNHVQIIRRLEIRRSKPENCRTWGFYFPLQCQRSWVSWWPVPRYPSCLKIFV